MIDSYRLMRMAEEMEEDAAKDDEAEEILPYENPDSADEFKRKYKEFYTDVKISIKEDW